MEVFPAIATHPKSRPTQNENCWGYFIRTIFTIRQGVYPRGLRLSLMLRGGMQDFKCILFFASVAEAAGTTILLLSVAGRISPDPGCLRLFKHPQYGSRALLPCVLCKQINHLCIDSKCPSSYCPLTKLTVHKRSMVTQLSSSSPRIFSPS